MKKSNTFAKITFEQESTTKPMEELKQRILRDGIGKADNTTVCIGKEFLTRDEQPRIEARKPQFFISDF